MSPRRKSIAWSVLFTAIGMLVGAFVNWSATERRLSIHIATADDRVAMMCELAEFMATATEAQCEATRAACPPRPATLHREVLARRCR